MYIEFDDVIVATVQCTMYTAYEKCITQTKKKRGKHKSFFIRLKSNKKTYKHKSYGIVQIKI